MNAYPPALGSKELETRSRRDYVFTATGSATWLHCRQRGFPARGVRSNCSTFSVFCSSTDFFDSRVGTAIAIAYMISNRLLWLDCSLVSQSRCKITTRSSNFISRTPSMLGIDDSVDSVYIAYIYPSANFFFHVPSDWNRRAQ